jgi:hypothetical protein
MIDEELQEMIDEADRELLPLIQTSWLHNKYKK